MKSKVAVLKTNPESVLEDYQKLICLAEYEKYLPKDKDTALKINISWHHFYPACSTTPWQLEGVIKALLQNGYKKELEIQGVGYKAQAQGKNLNLQLGFSHQVTLPIPAGITIKTAKPTQISIEGIDKQLVGQVAASIRALYKPEPYKGKGIRYKNEYVRRKAGKAVV